MGNITTLGQELIKNNQSCTIKLANIIADTPVVPFFLKNYSKLIELGHAPQIMNGSNYSKAIYVEIDSVIVAHMVFDIMKDTFNTAYIVFSYVDEAYRKQGLYKLMYKYFETTIKKSGSTKIMSFVHTDNSDRLAIWKSVGMIPQFYRMEKRI